MGTKGGRENTSVADQLFDRDESAEFSFFQAVRLLETLAACTPSSDRREAPQSVGEDCPPEEEPVRFEVLQSLSFPSSEIVRLEPRHQLSEKRERPDDETGPADLPDDRLPAVMETAFMGLTGPNGALPYHYTSLIIERLRQGDQTLKRFWDLFNHRFISLFYKAWRKYRLAFAYERHRQTESSESTENYTQLLLSLCGFGTPGIRGRQLVDDETFIYYSGYFSSDHRSAEGLRCLLTDAYGVPIEVEQFQGEWLPLSSEYQSCMPGGGALGRNTELGQDTVVGSRVWSCQHRFRIQIGPLNKSQFQSFMPDKKAFRSLCQLVRTYVGIEFDFDVQLVLQREDVSSARLGSGSGDAARLGWNSWVSRPGRQDHARDAVFRYDGIPHNGRETS
jgi:type VI secretion system protein ImpH